MESAEPSFVIRHVGGFVAENEEQLQKILAAGDVVVLARSGELSGRYLNKITVGKMEVALPTVDQIVHAQK